MRISLLRGWFKIYAHSWRQWGGTVGRLGFSALLLREFWSTQPNLVCYRSYSCSLVDYQVRVGGLEWIWWSASAYAYRRAARWERRVLGS